MTERLAALRAAADENLIAACDLLREHLGRPPEARRRFGAVEAMANGHEVAFYNPVLVLDGAATGDDVATAVDWVERQGMPCSVHVADLAPPDLDHALERLGFVGEAQVNPVMALAPIPPPPSAPPGIRRRAGGLELAEAWYGAFEAPERFRATFNEGFLGDPRVRIAVADLDGDPAAGAAALRSSQALGIYAVGTAERARRRGCGRAATWAAIEAGRSIWGSEVAVLQSTTMGFPLYRSMGFETVGTLRIWRRQSG